MDILNTQNYDRTSDRTGHYDLIKVLKTKFQELSESNVVKKIKLDNGQVSNDQTLQLVDSGVVIEEVGDWKGILLHASSNDNSTIPH